MEIPVYELNGIDHDDIGAMFRRKKAATVTTIATKPEGANTAEIKKRIRGMKKNGFAKFAIGIKDKAKRAEIIKKHRETVQGLQGIYNKYLMPVSQGFAKKKQERAFKKARVLLSLEGVDYDAYRLASIYMPYVADIDENDGGYIFDNTQVATVAALGEREFYEYAQSPEATELGKAKIFKKIKKAVKKAAKKVATATKKAVKATAKVVKKTVVQPVKAVAKATAKVTKAAVKSAANAVKATANVVKAGAQLATGKAKKAKETIKKAGSQVKKAIVQPVKTVAKQTKNVVKAAANATKAAVKTAAKVTKNVVKTTAKVTKKVAKATAKAVAKTIKAAGKVFKVIFIKINPVTVLMRQSLRMLIALNFFGMASRLNVANMTEAQAIAAGYTKQMYADAVKAKKRVTKFFVHMGGKVKNIENAIKNGAKKKALFKKDVNKNTKIKSSGEDNATLGDPGTIGAALASVGAFFAKIWNWIKNIVPKVGKAVKKVAQKTGNAVKKVAQKTAEVAKKVANKATTVAKKAADVAKKTGLLKKEEETTNPDTLQPMADDNNKKKIPWWVFAAAGVAVVTIVAVSSKKK